MYVVGEEVVPAAIREESSGTPYYRLFLLFFNIQFLYVSDQLAVLITVALTGTRILSVVQCFDYHLVVSYLWHTIDVTSSPKQMTSDIHKIETIRGS